MTSASKALLLLTAALLFAAPAAAGLAVPPLAARVTDQTGTLAAAQRAALEAKLAAFEAKKGSQIAVLVVASTRPEEIEQYAIRVVDAWKLGRKGVDDGALLLVAKDDRRLRIEVGRGLEGALTDATSRRIIAEYITPHFKAGDFYAGIDAGVERMIAVIDGEPLPAPAESWSADDESGVVGLNVILGLAILLSLGNVVLRRMLGRLQAAALTGSALGFVVWIVFGIVLAALAAFAVWFVLALTMGDSMMRQTRGGGWVMRSGGGSGGGSSSSRSGGGFSGGGGSFGGGGSSGSW